MYTWLPMYTKIIFAMPLLVTSFHNVRHACIYRNFRNMLLRKSIMMEKTKEKWSKVVVKPLPWRAKIVNDFFADSKIMETKSVQAKRLCKQRIRSTTASTGETPPQLPKWAVNSRNSKLM